MLKIEFPPVKEYYVKVDEQFIYDENLLRCVKFDRSDWLETYSDVNAPKCVVCCLSDGFGECREHDAINMLCDEDYRKDNNEVVFREVEETDGQ
jgi:hypothetical protein